MLSTNVGDIHSMISNDTLISKLHKEELCTCLKNTKINLSESSYIFQQIKSKYEIGDRLNIIRHISINFGEIKNIEITKILELLRVFGKCIEWVAFDSIIEIIESAFSRNKQQNNKNIKDFIAARNYNFDKIYDIFNKIADENDAEAMSYALYEKLHETTNNKNQDIFSYSLQESNFSLIRFMIESGIDYTQHKLPMTDKLNIENVKYFFKIYHFDNHTTNNWNETTLIYASRHGHNEVVKIILTVPGIDVNARDQWNRTALIIASLNGYQEIVKLLLTVPGIDANAKDDYNKTALIWASKQGYHEVVKILLTVPGIDVNAKNIYSKTALMFASREGYHEVVKLLLTVPGIDVNAKDSDNCTALIWASLMGRHEVVKLLLTVPGIDVNAKDNVKNTALIWASMNGHHEVVKLLLTVPGIDVNVKNWEHKTALTLASYYLQDEIVKLLLTVP